MTTTANNAESFDDVEDLVDLRSVWFGLRRRAALFVGVAAMVFTAVAAYAFLSTKLYTAETSLMIEPNTQVFAYGSEVLGQTSADPAMVDTEVELLRSRAMAIRVNNRLRALGVVDEPAEDGQPDKAGEGDFFSRRLAAIAADLAALQSNRSVLEVSADTENPDTSEAASGDEEKIQQMATMQDSEISAPSTTAQVMQLEAETQTDVADGADPRGVSFDIMAESAASEGGLAEAFGVGSSSDISKLMKFLEIQRIGSTFLIKIRHSDPSPKRSAQIANAYAEEYILQQLEAQYDELRQANSWIDARLATLREEVRAADAAAARYRAEQGLVNVTGESFSERALTEIATELSAARTNLASARARYNTAKRLVDTGAPFDSISEIMGSPLIAGLRGEYAELSRRQAELNVRYGARHPEIKKIIEEKSALKAQIEMEQRRIVDGLRSDVRFASAQVQSLEGDLQKAQGDMALNNEALVELQELERDIEATRGVYEALLNRQKELNERDQLANANARIIARAEPPEAPSKPRKKIILAGGFLLAMLFGGASAFVAESLDNRVRNTQDLRREFGPNAPVVLVPRIQSRLLFRQRRSDDVVRRYIQEEPDSNFAESLRDLRMYLKSAQRELNHPPVVAFLSVFNGEGATTLSFAFASLLSAGGARVAYVEYDSHNAAVFKASTNMREAGDDDEPLRLSDGSDMADGADDQASDNQGALSGNPLAVDHGEERGGHIVEAASMTLSKMDQQLVPARNVCGVQLLELERGQGRIDEFDVSDFAGMVENIRDDYDYVIIDAPSVLAKNEGGVIAGSADYTFLVTEWCATSRAAARAAAQRLIDIRANILSFVINKVDEKQRYYFRPEDRQFYFRKAG